MTKWQYYYYYYCYYYYYYCYCYSYSCYSYSCYCYCYYWSSSSSPSSGKKKIHYCLYVIWIILHEAILTDQVSETLLRSTQLGRVVASYAKHKEVRRRIWCDGYFYGCFLMFIGYFWGVSSGYFLGCFLGRLLGSVFRLFDVYWVFWLLVLLEIAMLFLCAEWLHVVWVCWEGCLEFRIVWALPGKNHRSLKQSEQ